ncbi:hypothetical protein RF11_10575 [Thelohanellus kitauei]|uniref:Uncharacterized protein n=1 Tax=Thelohanellus kitauei TaxID=669202 RepID=A0A0C2NDX1_THEKT|nr:hypothetical protein RF11_10575 [Thelohanellus kitauei]
MYLPLNCSAEIGFIHTSLSLLLFLSSERQFGNRYCNPALIMNSVYEGKPHYDLSRNCSYNDYLVYCLAKLMTRGPESLYNLHETIASIVYNSKFRKKLTVVFS